MAKKKDEFEKTVEFLTWLRKDYTLCLLIGKNYIPCGGAVTEQIVARYLDEKKGA